MSDILKMCHMVVKSLFKKSACHMYPVKPATFYKRTRGHIAIEPTKCILCTLCEKKCPTGAIRVDRNARKWEIDYFKCILCNNCIENCKPNCLKMENVYSAPVTSRDPAVVTVMIPEKTPAS